MIEQLSVSNFRVIKDISTKLERFTLIVGPNGCGKSTLLNSITDSLSYSILRAQQESTIQQKNAPVRVRRAISGEILQQFKSPASSSTSRPAKSIGGNRVTARSVLPASRIDSCVDLIANDLSGRVLVSKGVFQTATLFNDSTETTLGVEKIQSFSVFPSSIMNVKLDINAMRKPAPLSSDKKLAIDGSNAASSLADLKLENEDAFQSILDGLRSIVPGIKNIKIKRNAEKNTYELKFDTAQAKDIDIRYMSDGTLFTLGLLTLLNSINGANAIFLIDDLDQGLHPLAQKELVSLLRKILSANPEYQIIASTHSPFLISCMNPAEVLCMHLANDGFSRIGRLVDHNEYEKWKDEMNPGEFWSLFGDEWVATKGEVE